LIAEYEALRTTTATVDVLVRATEAAAKIISGEKELKKIEIKKCAMKKMAE
jgi:hypothetical protein